MHILIVKLSSLGDVILSLPAAQAIREAFPDAHLGWAVEKSYSVLLAGQEWLDEVVVWDRAAGLRGTWDFVRRLRRGRWDVAVDLQGLLRSGMTGWLSGAKRRVGNGPLKEQAHWFYSERLPLGPRTQHAVEHYHSLAAHLGGKMPEIPIPRPYLQGKPPLATSPGPKLFPLHPTPEDKASVDRWAKEAGVNFSTDRLVVLNPHCRKAANLWPAQRFTQLAERLLSQPGIKVAVSGGPIATPLCEEIAAPLGNRVLRADGKLGLLASFELFRRSACLVTGDTGPMHMTVAAGRPVVALFGPANPTWTGPYASDAVVFWNALDCAPCYGRKCHRGFDPPPCMTGIEVTPVYEATLRQCDRGEEVQRKSA